MSKEGADKVREAIEELEYGTDYIYDDGVAYRSKIALDIIVDILSQKDNEKSSLKSQLDDVRGYIENLRNNMRHYEKECEKLKAELAKLKSGE